MLREEPDATTRLVSRERYGYLRWWARFVVVATSVISFVMSRKMLRGIAERAEHAAPGPVATRPNRDRDSRASPPIRP